MTPPRTKATRTCSVDGCTTPVGSHGARGMCTHHYQQSRTDQFCSVDGCERTGQMRRGMCVLHYARWMKRGGTALPTTVERFMAGLVRMPSGCLEWTGDTNSDGYGRIGIGHTDTRTHRFAWELEHGPIPGGMVICHTCDNPPCCEPSHLFLGTRADNNADMLAKGRGHNQNVTHCPRNHLYDEANTLITSSGSRKCRACAKAATLAWYHAHKKGAS